MSDLKHTAVEILQSPKVGAAVSTATAGSGLGTLLDLIPNDIGKLATLLGIILTVLLIYVHVVQLRMKRAQEKREIERHLLETAVLRAQRLAETHGQIES